MINCWGGDELAKILFLEDFGVFYMFIFVKLRSNLQAHDEQVHPHIKCPKPQCFLNGFAGEEN